MRFLANENIPAAAVAALEAAGHDVVWVAVASPGSDDSHVLLQAAAEQRLILTFDKDFGELAFRSGLPASCGVILCRFAADSPERLAQRLVAAVSIQDQWQGMFSVNEDTRVRSIPLPAGSPPS